MTKFERIDEFKSIISNFETGDAQVVRYYYETSSIERTKSDTGSVRTERILLASGSQGENGDQAAWENTVQILGEK